MTENKQEVEKGKKSASTKKSSVRFADQLEDLQKQLEAANAEISAAEEKASDNWDKAVRAVAELENVRKRTEKDVASAHKYAIEKFANSLLPVIDSLEKAVEVEAHDEAAKAIKQGVELTLKMFIDSMGKFGLVQVNPVGKNFNPEFHEAMSMIEDPNYESNIVMQVYQVGYVLNDRLVRPARVVVSK